MKKFINKIILISVLGVFIRVSAQKVESKAKDILDTVSNYYRSKNAFYLKFTYTSGSGKSAKSETGVFYIFQDRYNLKLMGSEQIFDGNKIYNINREEREVTIDRPSGKGNLLSPVNYLDSYKKGYNVAYVRRENNRDIIKLTPILNSGIKQVLLYINFAEKRIEKVEQYASDNSFMRITVNQYMESPKVNVSMFSFNRNQYKNYLITEL